MRNMRADCNFCDAIENGTVDQLIDKGWMRAVISAPVRKTITACPEHSTEFNAEVLKVLPENFRKKQE